MFLSFIFSVFRRTKKGPFFISLIQLIFFLIAEHIRQLQVAAKDENLLESIRNKKKFEADYMLEELNARFYWNYNCKKKDYMATQVIR